MKLLRLDLQNWGPYYGEHTLDLDVTEHAPVVLVRGENMRGKTSLLRAIVWALYGRVREQDGRNTLDLSRMVNTDALSEGATDFGATLSFMHEGTRLTLSRTSVASFRDNGDIQYETPKLTLKIADGNALPERDVQPYIDNILSEEVSDFFLFDGEMLQSFDKRLKEDRDSTRQFVRAQVEKALGLPFLTQLRENLLEIEEVLASRVKKASRNNRDSERMRSELDKIESAIEIYERDIKSLRDLAESRRAEVDEIERQLESAAEVRDSFYKRKALEARIDDDEKRLADYREALATYASSNWWFPLAPRLQTRQVALTNELSDIERANFERTRIEVQIEALKEETSTQICRSCGQDLPHEHESVRQRRISELEAELLTIDSSGDLQKISEGLALLNRYAGGSAVVDRVEEQDKDIRKIRMDLEKAKSEVRMLDELLSGNTVEFAVLEAQRRDARDAVAASSASAAEKERDINDLRNQRNALRAKLARLPEVDPHDSARTKVYAEAVETVQMAFEGFRKSMREQVQEAATDIFLQLTTEPEYRGVLIRDDYTLAIIGPDGNPVEQISAGANQVLTTSFVGALARCSRDEAPMVMDTPLGRLDLGHRASVLKWLGSLPQVVLFVQSGEYDDKDAPLLEGKIGREYTIKRMSATRSEITS